MTFEHIDDFKLVFTFTFRHEATITNANLSYNNYTNFDSNWP